MPARGEDLPHQILLLPFSIFAPQEFAYLKDGIAATLSSRLQRPGTNTLIPTDEMLHATTKPNASYRQETIQTIGASLGADLAIVGSVTIVGDGVSTAIQLWQVPEGKSRINFHASANRPDAVLEHLDQFIARMETEVLGIAAKSQKTPTAPRSQPIGSPAVTWKSQPLDTAIIGMAIADLSPLPGKEIVLIDNQNLWIYQRDGDRLIQMALIKGKANLRLIAVDASDINANGRAEIFVSAFHPRLGEPRSFVVEWLAADEKFEVSFENLPTYFRVAELASAGSRLVGQSKGYNDFFGGRPAILQWDEGYKIDKPIALPSQIQIYDFALGSFLPGQSDTIISLNRRKALEIYRNDKERQWVSEVTYGGSSVYLDNGQTPQNQAKQLKQVGEETLKRTYLNPRMLMKDLDKDGVNELLVVSNKDASGGLFRRTRLLTSGRIVCLNWQPLGPAVKWETPKVSGHITDMALDDTNGDGQKELVYVVIDREAKGFSNRRSYIVAHGLRALKK